jgi:hypothetical protein
MVGIGLRRFENEPSIDAGKMVAVDARGLNCITPPYQLAVGSVNIKEAL